ncbi:probable calcium-binding protein CML10 [Elaeis guineensis]|uniref:Probable calcium-binding protein CML10 n=1 Tax=Elaeis guineensis var. tenera TaxID=51953 RepID=A0A6I9R895_ELAGV|nr:probable calcium-binding protein CML10 [Elaeis guineensis]
MGLMRCILPRRNKSKPPPPPPSPSPSPSSTSPATPTLAAETPTKQLERVFNKFDSNGDGRISSSELAAIFRCLGHPPTDEELEIMMGEADFNGDGYISLEEFLDLNTNKVDAKAALEDLRHAFSVFDMDRNGSISVDELNKVLRSIGEGATMAQCKKMIDGVDQDGDGFISFEEFKDMMMGPSFTPASIDRVE